MEVIFLLLVGALLAATLHKEPKPPEPKKKKPEKPEIRTFQLEKITRTTTPDGKEECIREVTPVVHNYPVAWTESNNHRE